MLPSCDVQSINHSFIRSFIIYSAGKLFTERINVFDNLTKGRFISYTTSSIKCLPMKHHVKFILSFLILEELPTCEASAPTLYGSGLRIVIRPAVAVALFIVLASYTSNGMFDPKLVLLFLLFYCS